MPAATPESPRHGPSGALGHGSQGAHVRIPGPGPGHADAWARDASPTMRPMFAMVWHFWIGVVLSVGALVTLVGIGANYLRKVESTRYPKGR